jgi:hypothetical protein
MGGPDGPAELRTPGLVVQIAKARGSRAAAASCQPAGHDHAPRSGQGQMRHCALHWAQRVPRSGSLFSPPT